MSYHLAIALIAGADAFVVLAVAYVCSIPFLHDRRPSSGTPWILRAELGPATEWDPAREKAPELQAELA